MTPAQDPDLQDLREAVIFTGKPDLRYEQFPYDQVQQVLTQMGVPPQGAALYIEMYKAIRFTEAFMPRLV